MFLNMDNSRNINDAMGHAVGDRVICEIGRRIDEMAGDEHLVAHLGGTVGELLRVVDAAVHHATRRGGAVHQFYSSEISAAAQRRMDLERGLRRAIEKNQLSVVYQPKVRLANCEIVGTEALLR